MHKLNPRTAALLSAFGWAVGYLLAGKVLAVLLPVPPGGAARSGEPAPCRLRPGGRPPPAPSRARGRPGR